MALKPAPVESRTGSRETLYAIIGSFIVAVVLATVVTGNPFRSLVHAYTDYSREPDGALPAASTTHAPASATTTK